MGAGDLATSAVPGDYVISSVAVEVTHADFVPFDELVVNDLPLPSAGLVLRIHDDLVPVPRLDRSDDSRTAEAAYGDVARSRCFGLFFVSAREPRVFPADLVSLASWIVERDSVESGSQQLFTGIVVPLHNTDTVQNTSELVVDKPPLPCAVEGVRNGIVDERDVVFVLGSQRVCADQRAIDQLL